jgi:hypothetical protein
MECPHCHQEIDGKHCANCGAVSLPDARFCMQCGALLEQLKPESTPDQDDGIDLDNRVLCPDGTCTGIIINGRCSECGRPYPGEGSRRE